MRKYFLMWFCKIWIRIILLFVYKDYWIVSQRVDGETKQPKMLRKWRFIGSSKGSPNSNNFSSRTLIEGRALVNVVDVLEPTQHWAEKSQVTSQQKCKNNEKRSLWKWEFNLIYGCLICNFMWTFLNSTESCCYSQLCHFAVHFKFKYLKVKREKYSVVSCWVVREWKFISFLCSTPTFMLIK